MGPPIDCISCGGIIQATSKKVIEISAISGRSLKDIMTAHFWNDGALMDTLTRKHATLCKDCHSLVEQIDAFEQSLMKTRENFEHRRQRTDRNNHNDLKNAKIKMENNDSRDGNETPNTVIPQMKQEPEWTGNDDFEWDMENPHNFLDATLQEMDTDSNENNGSFNDDSDEDDDDFDESFVPKGARRLSKGEGRVKIGRKSSAIVPQPDWTLYDLCQAHPDKQLICPDRSALGMDWFAEQKTQLQFILSDLEQDLDYFREKMPLKITTVEESLEWDITMLRSEVEILECGMPGELNCFHCTSTFPNCAKKLEHILECHSGNERQFVCGVCSTYDEIDESSMFTHIKANHFVADDACEKSRHGPRHPIPEETDPQTFACRLCPIISRSELAYWYHWYCRHKKYRSRQCDICGKSTGLTSAPQFRSHFLSEHCNFKYECHHCSAHSSTSELFLLHLKDHEKNNSKSVKTSKSKKRNYPTERKSRTKRSSVGIKVEEGIPDDDSNAEPLTPVARVQQNPDLCLEMTNEPDQIQLIQQLPAEMWQDIFTGLSLLKSMPSKIDSDSLSIEWDVAMLKLECPKQSFGIPGDKKCYKCGDVFLAIPDKQLHSINTHHTDPFFCAICQQPFSKEASGVAHMTNKHGDDWRTDERIKLPEGYTTCDTCGLAANSELAYWHHKFQSHKRYKNITCPLCEHTSNNFIAFLRHVLVKHASYKYKCFMCDKITKSMDSFREHLKQHERGKIKKEHYSLLDDEDEVFEREEIEINGKKILRKKIGKKGKKPPVPCEICGTISKGAFNNARHLYTMHGIKREVQCDKCDTLCESVRAMLEHKKNHHSSASCHLCGKVFVEKGHLENHLMRHGIGKDGKNHQNERDFMCEICSKTFTRKNYLVIHMKNHSEKSIKCTVCAKMFRWNSALQAHLTAAHGMGPKEGACTCEFCGRQFQDKSNYRQHRYTHLQVKPFNCEACGKGFIRRDLVKSHKEKCHASSSSFNMA